MIKIELTEDDALLFRKFMQHHEHFADLLLGNVLDIRGGSYTVHVNVEGIIDSIEGASVPLYRRGKPNIQFLYSSPQVCENLKEQST